MRCRYALPSSRGTAESNRRIRTVASRPAVRIATSTASSGAALDPPPADHRRAGRRARAWFAGNPDFRSVDAAARAGMSRGTLGEVVDRLERRALVARVEVLQGGRQVLLQLTDDGAELWRSVAPQVVETEREFAAQPSGQRLLGALVQRIRAPSTAIAERRCV